MTDEIAILMAAGRGERMRPITYTTPKPLVKVHGKPMIETILDGLERRGVRRIYVAIGYLAEQFAYLQEKYDNLDLVENREYATKNNISSIHVMGSLMGSANCFVCEADLVVSDPSIFDAKLPKSCYYGKMVKGHSDDWVFDLTDGRITRVGKGGDDEYNMCGITYFLKGDAKIVADAVTEAYRHPGHETMYWDEIVDQQLDKIDMFVHPVTHDQIMEIDSVAELQAMDPSYANDIR